MTTNRLRIVVTTLACVVLAAVAASFASASARGYFYPESLPDAWNATGESKRGKTGGWVHSCPAWPAHDLLDVWGTDLYTDDSSVCTAAVHAGKITYELGGAAVFEPRPGADAYEGTNRNGVSTQDYEEFDGSFVIKSGSQGVGRSGGQAVGMGLSQWSEDAQHLRSMKGKRFAYWCTGPVKNSSVWGTDVYSDDSSVCQAAIHAGAITKTRFGVVVIEIRRGQSSYRGSTRYGVTSKAFGSWRGSFAVIGLLPPAP